ncbi:hypothetical protein BKX93_13750 [Chromobacterium vaccinii]|uniref:Integrase catalytic domain-containing protein n=1 Tax=Chromobacterium vaccinii TaxID=1108595 RepID=A0A1D9LI51_9NEIS|nr:hypothetical protein BKX93_13750 [Chromobacterium vaccinii]
MGRPQGHNPTDRGKLDSKRYIVVDRRCLPLALYITSANQRNSIMFESLVNAILAILGLPGKPRKRPDRLHTDKGTTTAVVGTIFGDGASRPSLSAKALRAARD